MHQHSDVYCRHYWLSGSQAEPRGRSVHFTRENQEQVALDRSCVSGSP